MAASPGNLMFSMALSYAVSVVKADCVQDGAMHCKSCMKEESVSAATYGLSDKLIGYVVDCKL